MVLPSGSIASMVCVNVTGVIVGVDPLEKFIFAPDSTIAKLSLVGQFCDVSTF